MKTKKHLFNGSIYIENKKFIARDLKDNYLTYGDSLDDCKREVFVLAKKTFNDSPFQIDFFKKLGCTNFSAYKRGKDGKNRKN